MAPKKSLPAPIDRPLSRAYLREFTGWSTAYPPGLSDPTSLRIMENTLVNRDGSMRVRPGLRYLSYSVPPTELTPGSGFNLSPVGTHEVFFRSDGTKAYLFAVRELDSTVGFRVLRFDEAGSSVHPLEDDFLVPQGAAVLNFSAATTYVKYLQIDNKVFALSNAGEGMRLFTVGESKSAKKLSSIDQPGWNVDDKLRVVHPDAAWIPGPLLSTRTNLLNNPDFETNTSHWAAQGALTKIDLSNTVFRTGVKSLRVSSLPSRTNLMPNPLTDVVNHGIDGWGDGGADMGTVLASATYLKATMNNGGIGRTGFIRMPRMSVKAGKTYRFAYDLDPSNFGTKLWIRVRYYTSSGAQIGSYADLSISASAGRRFRNFTPAPSGAVRMGLFVRVETVTANTHITQFKNVLVSESSEAVGSFSGASGVDYLWEGTPGNSVSVYHPPATVEVYSNKAAVTALQSTTMSAYFRAGTIGRSVSIGHKWYNSSGVVVSSAVTAVGSTAPDVWTRFSKSAPAVAKATHAALSLQIVAVPRGEIHYLDSALFQTGAALTDYFSGATEDTPTTDFLWSGTPHGSSSVERIYSSAIAIPVAETPTAGTLISTNVAGSPNDFNFGFFYTFNNEIGESAASQVTVLRAQRAWSQWRWEMPNAAGEPNGVATSDPNKAADQLVAIMPEAVFDQAVAQGAQSWSLYMLTWSNQDSVPVEGVKIAERKLTATSLYGAMGWARANAESHSATEAAPVPSVSGRYNYTNPNSAGQGLVAADRIILVNDPNAAAVIRWSSNRQGEYINFTANRGGGYKTLTSGNLYVPAVVKLWQNPQSVDTLTILCRGTDGHSTGYYMAPASVTSQSDNTQIMGFEETTATPGTTSPYGCEVFNNALYHPLDEQLMKSTASNYNINHKSLTDQIEHDWFKLVDKDQIISAQHDNRLYYIVNNPEGEPLEEGQNGNEVWIYDAASDKGSWSRWLVQGHSLRKIEQGGKVYLSIMRPDGIYYFDPDYDRDDFLLETDEISQKFIPWRIETNVQGANRAHDAWAHLQQMQLSLGNFQGALKWGLRSWDVHGQAVDISKIYRDLNPKDEVDRLPFDIDDFLLVKRGLQQWFFYAGSLEENDAVSWSSGQINSVQYRYAPLSVNMGYEQGSIETFEYGRATANWSDRNTTAGIPDPMVDVRRP